MAGEEAPLEDIRRELIRLLENDEWETTQTAEKDGREVLRQLGEFPSQCGLVDFILDRLRDGYPMHAVALGEPPDSLGTGYVINFSSAVIRDLYIKVTIVDDGKVRVLSFKISKHHKEDAT